MENDKVFYIRWILIIDKNKIGQLALMHYEHGLHTLEDDLKVMEDGLHPWIIYMKKIFFSTFTNDQEDDLHRLKVKDDLKLMEAEKFAYIQLFPHTANICKIYNKSAINLAHPNFYSTGPITDLVPS